MRNKGEMLVESLLSIFLISSVLLPISNLVYKFKKNDQKIESNIKFNYSIKNILEILKSVKYEKIKNSEGYHEFNNIEDFLNFFELPREFLNYDSKKINNDFKKNYKVKIEKTNYNYDLLNTRFVYLISVNNHKDVYIPYEI